MALLHMRALGGHHQSRRELPTAETDSTTGLSFDGDGPRLSTQMFLNGPVSTNFFDLVAEVKKSTKQTRWLVDPNSTPMKVWDMVVLALLLFTATVTPYEVAFLSSRLGDPAEVSDSELNVLFFINRIVDVLFLADIVLQFLTPIRAADGTLVTDHKALAARYLKFWFFIDLISILPFDLLGLVVDSSVISSLKLLRIVRLLRLVKLTRILRASRIFARWERVVNVSHSMISITKFLLTVMFVSHLTACLFRIVPELERAENSEGELVNWVTALNDKLPAPLDLNSPSELYAAALYWSVMTMTTIGYGDVVPVTHGERIYTIGVMLVGGSVYAYVVGGICALIASIDLASEEYYQMLDMATAFTRDANLPEVLRRRVRYFVMSGRNMHRRRFYWRLLKEFSPHLRSEVCRAIATPLLSKAVFLLCTDQDERRRFLGHIGQLLRFQHCVPDEVVFRTGVVLQQIYVVERGTVVCLGPFLLGAKRSNMIPKGGFFSIVRPPPSSLFVPLLTTARQQSLLRGHRSLYAAIARDSTELVSLDKDALLTVLDPHQYPYTCARVRSVAIRLSFHMAMFERYLKAVGQHPLEKEQVNDKMERLVSNLGVEEEARTKPHARPLSLEVQSAAKGADEEQTKMDGATIAGTANSVDAREEMKEGRYDREKTRSLRPPKTPSGAGRSTGSRERRRERERGSRDSARKGRGTSSSRKPRKQLHKKRSVWRSQEVMDDEGTEAESDMERPCAAGAATPIRRASSKRGGAASPGELPERMAALEHNIASLDDALRRMTTGVLVTVILLFGLLTFSVLHSVSS